MHLKMFEEILNMLPFFTPGEAWGILYLYIYNISVHWNRGEKTNKNQTHRLVDNSYHYSNPYHVYSKYIYLKTCIPNNKL